MQLTQFTDYSLRALIFIAVRQEYCTIAEIAKAYRISQHHLTKIIHNLSKLGLIKTVRGRNGGINLAVDPTTVNLKELILKLEPHFDIVPCFNIQKQNCCIAPECKLKNILLQAQKAFFNVLAEVTLAEVLENTKSLQKLLGIPIK